LTEQEKVKMQLSAYVRKYGATNGPVVYASVEQSTLKARHKSPAERDAEAERHHRLMVALPFDPTAEAAQSTPGEAAEAV
jgi:hypothetical protein